MNAEPSLPAGPLEPEVPEEWDNDAADLRAEWRQEEREFDEYMRERCREL